MTLSRAILFFLLSTPLLEARLSRDTHSGHNHQKGNPPLPKASKPHMHTSEDRHEDHHEEVARFGSNQAITAASREHGIQISPRAAHTLKLQYLRVVGTGAVRIPTRALVSSQDEVGLYRLRGGWHKLIPATVTARTGSTVVVEASDLQPGDQVTIESVPLLRVAELEAWGGSGDGHGH